MPERTDTLLDRLDEARGEIRRLAAVVGVLREERDQAREYAEHLGREFTANLLEEEARLVAECDQLREALTYISEHCVDLDCDHQCVRSIIDTARDALGSPTTKENDQ